MKIPPIIDVELDIFLFIRLSHGNVSTVLLQLVNLQHTEAVVLNTEGGVDDVRDAVLQHPLEGGEEVRIHCLDINQTDTLVQKHLKVDIRILVSECIEQNDVPCKRA